MKQAKNVNWSSNISFILAASGAAIGLGNIWKLPYLVNENGGGTFLLTYILISITIGAAILLGEFAWGRMLGHPIHNSIKEKVQNKYLYWLCYLYPLVSFLILSFYLVIAGWALYYLVGSLFGSIQYNTSNPEYYLNIFETFISNPVKLGFFTICVSIFSCLINYSGSKGIEKANNFMLPALIVIISIMVVTVINLDNSSSGFKYIFSFNPSYITASSLLSALGHSFFTMGIGMGIMIVYASTLSKTSNLRKATIGTSVVSSGIGILTCSLVIPVLFSFGIDVDAGSGLTFVTIPSIFHNMPFSYVLSSAFFASMCFASLTSIIALNETVITFAQNFLKTTRNKTIIIYCVVISSVALVISFSFNILSNFKLINLNLFNFISIISDVMLTAGVLLSCLIIGHYVSKKSLSLEVYNGKDFSNKTFVFWVFCIKYIIPFIVLIPLISIIF